MINHSMDLYTMIHLRYHSILTQLRFGTKPHLKDEAGVTLCLSYCQQGI